MQEEQGWPEGHQVVEIDPDRMTVIPLGFQPGSIGWVDGRGGNETIVVTDYFGLAVCLATVGRQDHRLTFSTGWVDSAICDGREVRLFHDVDPVKGVNRLDAAHFASTGIFVGRNAERRFFHLAFPKKIGGSLWEFDGADIVLPDEHIGKCLLSSRIDDGVVTTLESAGNGRNLEIAHYSYHHNTGKCELVDFRMIRGADNLYGLASRKGDHRGDTWFVTGGQSSMPLGIYRFREGGLTRVVPDVYGRGLVFLKDGSALVARYGQTAKGAFKGEPGALVHVPSQFFDE